jgi:hypothetical protein
MDLFQKTKLSVMKKRGIVFIAVGFIGSTEMKMTRAVLELEKGNPGVIFAQTADFPSKKEMPKPRDLGLTLTRFEDMPRLSYNFEAKSKYINKTKNTTYNRIVAYLIWELLNSQTDNLARNKDV